MAKRRQVIDVPGVRHGTAPIPMGIRIGNMVYSSGVHGMDPESGQVPEDPARQVELVFQHMRTIVENAGGTTDDIAMVIFNLTDDAHRPLVHAEWIKMFPHDDDRPARNTHIMPLGMGMIIHVLMTAVLE
ncbi:RidA family protein [Acrocarpospora macrocephala]|uniref:Enamine deaminase RidA n=1 Tax=Acrocarpospora macrocephala TaxID=150177 RepID=A0A5M3WTJ2_9ACTN|nr:Rid family hydrolase [Acrocarpospora macrocephala]GES11836.1 enamine deaminase RidA [Acrocarpospora macrocephala]